MQRHQREQNGHQFIRTHTSFSMSFPCVPVEKLNQFLSYSPHGHTYTPPRQSGPPHLVRDAAVRACVPWNEVCDQPLHPAAVLGAQVLPRQAHVPVWTGSQHGEEGHQVAGPVHRELGRWSRSAGDADETRRSRVHPADRLCRYTIIDAPVICLEILSLVKNDPMNIRSNNSTRVYHQW